MRQCVWVCVCIPWYVRNRGRWRRRHCRGRANHHRSCRRTIRWSSQQTPPAWPVGRKKKTITRRKNKNSNKKIKSHCAFKHVGNIWCRLENQSADTDPQWRSITHWLGCRGKKPGKIKTKQNRYQTTISQEKPSCPTPGANVTRNTMARGRRIKKKRDKSFYIDFISCCLTNHKRRRRKNNSEIQNLAFEELDKDCVWIPEWRSNVHLLLSTSSLSPKNGTGK